MNNRQLEKSKDQAKKELGDFLSTAEAIIDELVGEIEALEEKLEKAENKIEKLEKEISELNNQGS